MNTNRFQLTFPDHGLDVGDELPERRLELLVVLSQLRLVLVDAAGEQLDEAPHHAQPLLPRLVVVADHVLGGEVPHAAVAVRALVEVQGRRAEQPAKDYYYAL